jgi:small subunit ribosomal protein S9
MNEQSTSEPEKTPSPDAAPAPPTPETTPASAPTPPAAEAPAAQASPPTVDDKPAEVKAAADKPAEDKPAEVKAAADKPAEVKPAADKPAEVKAAADKPAADKPADVKAAAGKPRADKRPAPTPPARKPREGHWWWGIGRRKAAVARVRLRPGDGKFIVNKRPYDKYLNEERDQNDLMAVLHKTKTAGAVDVYVNVRGGGFTGQAGAIVLGLGRALLRYDDSLESILRDNGFLTRDPRKVERKKYGQPGARRRFQFSKR